MPHFDSGPFDRDFGAWIGAAVRRGFRGRANPYAMMAEIALRNPRKRPPSRGGELQPEPVEPPRPSTLSGGAEATLEFDE